MYTIYNIGDESTVVLEFAQSAKIIFIIDDSQVQSIQGAELLGSWDSNGNFDGSWNDKTTDFYFNDTGEGDDATADDNIWTATKYLVPDEGANTWEWNFNLVYPAKTVKSNFPFSVTDASPQTLTHTVVLLNEFNANIGLSPNPANNYINISADNNYFVEIIDLNGKIIKSEKMKNNSSKIDISNKQAGIYIIRLTKDNKVYSYKFIKDAN